MQDKLYEREQDVGSMSKSMLIVMVFTMLGKITGFLRESVMASRFGADNLSDIYKTAFDVPCLFLTIIVTALTATLVPVYATQRTREDGSANRFISNLLTVGMILSVLILLLTNLFLEPLVVRFIFPKSDWETQRLIIYYARMMLPMGLFVFLSRMISAYLQANFCFATPALSQIMLNITIIVAILVSSGANLTYVAIGSILGWALQFLVQVPRARQIGLRYRPVIDLKEPGLRQVAILMLPVLISSAFDQVYFACDRAFTSDVAGRFSTLDYSNRLSTMVSSVLLTTVATVLYPSLVRHTGEREKITRDLSFGVNLNLLIALPATAALILLQSPIIQLVYQRGEFTAVETGLTAPILACYAVGILGVGLRELCNRCFYAYKEMYVPTITGIGIVLLNIALNAFLYSDFGAPGIAAATSISSLMGSIILLIMLHRKRKIVDGKHIGRCLWKSAFSAGVMTFVLWLLSRTMPFAELGATQLLLDLGILLVVGVAVYVAMLLVLRTEELHMAFQMIKKKLEQISGR